MDYKKCEFCGEQVHIRSKKCPFCENVLSEEPIIVDEPEVVEESVTETQEQVTEANAEENQEISQQQPISQTSPEPKFNVMVGKGEPKDYIYKAEVRHSVEYVKPLSNWVKTFLSAFCVMPFFGQILGAFFGVYYSASEDADRRSFGSALITLSILIFLFYMMEVKYVMSMPEFKEIYNSLMQ